MYPQGYKTRTGKTSPSLPFLRVYVLVYVPVYVFVCVCMAVLCVL